MEWLRSTSDFVAKELWGRDAVERPEMTYRTHWRVIGCLGVGLPILVYAYGALVAGRGWVPLPSISDYYTLRTRDFFVGILWTTAWFLFAYKGYDKLDDKITDLACVLALAVSLVPNTDSTWGWFHLISAVGLFIVLALISFFLFTKTKATEEDSLWVRIKALGRPARPDTRPARKRRRDRLYRWSGALILVFLAGAGLSKLLAPHATHPAVFIFEALALFAFGSAWLTKGGVFPFMNDEAETN